MKKYNKILNEMIEIIISSFVIALSVFLISVYILTLFL